MSKPRIVVGLSGATGIVYGVRLLEALRALSIETHLVVTKAAFLTLAYETELKAQELKAMADVYHPITDVGASIASGSFKTMGMVVAPCSMKSLAEMAHGLGGNLLSRAADVTLKERRRLVVMPRETPLNLVHIENMAAITRMGGIIFPPVPGFYNKPKTIDDLVDDAVGRVLDLFGLDNDLAARWE